MTLDDIVTAALAHRPPYGLTPTEEDMVRAAVRLMLDDLIDCDEAEMYQRVHAWYLEQP